MYKSIAKSLICISFISSISYSMNEDIKNKDINKTENKCIQPFNGNIYENDIFCSNLKVLPKEFSHLIEVKGSISIIDGNITNIDELLKLQNVGTYISLKNNELEDIDGIINVKNLSNFNASYNNLKNINSLKGIKYFEFLDLSFNFINNLEGLSELEKAGTLLLNNNKIYSLTNLTNITNLNDTILMLGYNDLKNLEGLEKIEKIKKLDLYGNKIENLEGLKNLKEIEFLNLKNNKIVYLDGLNSLNKITDTLDLSYNYINSTKGLNLYSVDKLYLNDNNINNIESLSSLVSINKLYLSSNNLTDLNGLNKLRKINDLVLDNNHLTNLNELKKLPKITFLSIKNNPLNDIKGICSLKPLNSSEGILINVDNKRINNRCSMYDFVCGSGYEENVKFKNIDKNGVVQDITYENFCIRS